MSKIKAIGEIALRVTNLDPMVDFYERSIGLELMRRDDRLAFFKIAEGFGGHTQVLALFDRGKTSATYTPPNSATSSFDHLAFTIAKEDFEGERKRLELMGFELTFAFHEWVGWRSLYLADPEGNTVELVCYDESYSACKSKRNCRSE